MEIVTLDSEGGERYRMKVLLYFSLRYSNIDEILMLLFNFKQGVL